MNIAETVLPNIAFDNSYARDLDGFYVPWQAEQAPAPKLLQFNHALAVELGLDADSLASGAGLAMFSGNAVPDGAVPLAQAYAGHQFGGFSPQLGDGRALLLGEVVDPSGARRDIQLKGSGLTPFSRGGDGKAAVGPVLREYLIGEAMYGLGIPTTRALAAVATGATVRRETALPGAVLTRVAASHIRVGTFQFFAARQEEDKVRQLADYAIARHYPELQDNENPYLAFFKAVANAQASLVARWMHVGFIHGVMNTDNMTISGETIDYGPCAFMDIYSPNTVFSSIDETGRYAYANQPKIAQWNLARFAETLLPLIHADPDEAVRLMSQEIQAFPDLYLTHWMAWTSGRIGLSTEDDGDLDLVNALFTAMEGQEVDYTQFFRKLSHAVRGDSAPARDLFIDPMVFDAWADGWRARIAREDDISAETRATGMDCVNPVYIPRNHKVEEALTAAVRDNDLEPFRKLLDVMSDPFTERNGLSDYEGPEPGHHNTYRTYCGT